jgi:GTPase
VAARAPKSALVVVNKIDQASQNDVLTMLGQSGEFGFAEYFPVSALTGAGVDVLREAIVSRMPEGPAYYPTDVLADVDETFWIGELVREQLLHRTSEELPHSIACRVTEWEDREGKGPYVRVEVLVERESQRPIVIGKGGANVKAVGMAVREQLPPGAYLDIHVKVDRDWQRRAKSLDRLGY